MWTCVRLRALRRVLGRPARHRSSCRAVGACVALAGSLLANRALADVGLRVAVEWEKLGGLLRRGEVAPRPSWLPDADRLALALAPPAPSLLDGAQGPGHWSLVARDWEAARSLMGRLTPTDEVKRGRSKRMVLLRGLFASGPVAPFVQLGLGQWRIDPDMPAMPHDAVLAGQAGAGVELALASWVSVALEVDCTLLNPGRLDNPDAEPPALLGANPRPQDARWVHPPALWGSFLAARARF